MTADGTRSVAAFPEIAIVLGGGLKQDGLPTWSTRARADAGADLAHERNVAVIVSGSHGNGPPPARTEAALMADHLSARGIDRSRIFLEDESRDTVTNAAFVAERYLVGVAPRPLWIVTSPFHMERSLATFALVLGPSWPLKSRQAAPGSKEAEHAVNEALYLDRTRALFEGLEPGDITRIAERARTTLHQRISDAPVAR